MTKTYEALILGGGAGGICVAARLARHLPAGSIAIVEPSRTHYYQPLWTLVGGGVVAKEKTRREERDVIPPGVQWIEDSVARVDPEKKIVRTATGQELSYHWLVVATGLEVDFSAIDGLAGHLGRDGVCSIYDYDGAEVTARMLHEFKGGPAIFTMPPLPIKCAGAPQKIMYLADDIFRRQGVRDRSTIRFATAGKVLFGVPVFAKALEGVVQRKQIEASFEHRLVGIDAAARRAHFETPAGRVSLDYALLHVVPPMRAHAYVRESGLAVAEGAQKHWLAVDPYTLRHLQFPEVFGIGDVTGVPNSKTGAAVRKQAPIVADNLLAARAGRPLPGRYDGYSSCPLVTGFGKVILAEFGYDGKLLPSFPLDPTKERRSMWILKRYLLPKLYWTGMLPGRL